MEFFK